MESVITIILGLSVFQFSLQLSVFQLNKIEWLWLALVGVGIYLAYPYAIEQSYLLFQQTLNNATIVNNFIVIMIVETLGGLLMSIFMIRYMYNEPVKKIFNTLNYIPGIIAFPALFYIESYGFLSISDFDFQYLALILCVVMPLALWLLKTFLVFFIPEIDVRYELKFFLHTIQLILGIILSIMVYKIPVLPSNVTYDFVQLGVIALTFLIFGILGIFKYHIDIKKQQK